MTHLGPLRSCPPKKIPRWRQQTMSTDLILPRLPVPKYVFMIHAMGFAFCKGNPFDSKKERCPVKFGLVNYDQVRWKKTSTAGKFYNQHIGWTERLRSLKLDNWTCGPWTLVCMYRKWLNWRRRWFRAFHSHTVGLHLHDFFFRLYSSYFQIIYGSTTMLLTCTPQDRCVISIPFLGALNQGCRFVPYTFSETKPQMVPSWI